MARPPAEPAGKRRTRHGRNPGGALQGFRQRRRERGQRQALARQRADAVHQVRNALTTLTLQTELAATTADPADQHAIVLAMRDRLAQLQRFLDAREAATGLAHIDRGVAVRRRHAEPLPAFDLPALARDLTAEWQPVAAQRQVTLSLMSETPSAVWALGHRDALREAVSNVLANALEHTPPGGCVNVSVDDTAARGVSLRVADNGPGVAPKSRKRIFSRQFRNVDCCDAKNAGSRGVGLDLVYRIVKENRGKTMACDGIKRPDGKVGLTIVITLGRAKSTPDGAAQQHVE